MGRDRSQGQKCATGPWHTWMSLERSKCQMWHFGIYLQITAADWRYCICHENTICPYQAVRPQQPIFPPLLREAATLDYLSDQRPHSAGTRTAYPFCLCSDVSVQLSLYDHHQKCNHSTSSCLISIPITQLCADVLS